MSKAYTLATGLVILLASTAATAATITSTTTGGPWSDNATWIGGVVPGAADDVVIAGPVEVAGTAACLSLTVNTTGMLAGALVAPPRTLVVGAEVANYGTITDGPIGLDLEVGGDLHNAGLWDNAQTLITGTVNREISHDTGFRFVTHIVFAADAAGDLIATTPLEVNGNVDVTGGRLVLRPDCPFTLDAGVFSGDMAAHGNEMRFVSWSYLTWCTLDDVVLVGNAEASIDVTFTTRVVVADLLQNGGVSGGGAVTVEGDLVNHGVITNDQYSFLVRVTGDVENYGTISNPQLELLGVGVEHHLSMGPSAVISAPIFLPEFQAATIVADTPVRLAGGLGLGVGTLVLEPGSSLDFEDWGGVGSGTILANGNEITVGGNGAISQVTVDQGVFADQVVVRGDILCTGGLLVTGTVAGWPWAAADLTVEDLLRNEGTIRDGDHPVRINALGDLANLGAMTNARVAVAGVADQRVGAGPQGIAVPEFVLESGLAAASYQWYRDGEALPGENAANLVMNTVGPADFGTYHCEAGDATSRLVTIGESIATTDTPGAGTMAALSQNHPNPFNPATNIAFTLEHPARVSLTVFDLAGREVARLVEGERGAGFHQIAWQPKDLPSGIYVYRLRAGATELTRKCTLLK